MSALAIWVHNVIQLAQKTLWSIRILSQSRIKVRGVSRRCRLMTSEVITASGQALKQKNPRSCGVLHPPAGSHDRHRIQLPPRKQKSMMGCYRSRDKALNPLSLVKQIDSNIGWFGLERQ